MGQMPEENGAAVAGGAAAAGFAATVAVPKSSGQANLIHIAMTDETP